MKKLLLLLSFVLISTALIACGSGSGGNGGGGKKSDEELKNALVGTWVSEDMHDLVFKDDNTGCLLVPIYGGNDEIVDTLFDCFSFELKNGIVSFEFNGGGYFIAGVRFEFNYDGGNSFMAVEKSDGYDDYPMEYTRKKE